MVVIKAAALGVSLDMGARLDMLNPALAAEVSPVIPSKGVRQRFFWSIR